VTATLAATRAIVTRGAKARGDKMATAAS